MDVFSPSFLTASELEWELHARGLEVPSSESDARKALRSAIAQDVQIGRVEGDLAAACADAALRINQFKGIR
ncbi:hypothetical protein DMENIID0001_134950 [Sergentomyia squamirostris]